MSETTWTPTSNRLALRQPRRVPARGWITRVAAPLHRVLDAALRAGELRELDAGTLADIGYRRD